MVTTVVPHLSVTASKRHGVITREELLLSGVPRTSIDTSIAEGQLCPVHPGVYVVAGVPRMWLSRAAATVLYVDRQARRRLRPSQPRPVVALSGTAGACVLGVPSVREPRTPFLVSNPLSRSKKALVRHRPTLLQQDTVVVDGIRVTNGTWTAIEVMTAFPDSVGPTVVGDLLRLGLTVPSALQEAAARSGLLSPAQFAAERLGWARPRSRSERRLLEAIAAAGLDLPVVNQRVDVAGRVFELDLAWVLLRLVVEVDGPHHDQPGQRERDRERDRWLRRHGWTVIRVRSWQVQDDVAGIVDLVRTALIAAHEARLAS